MVVYGGGEQTRSFLRAQRRQLIDRIQKDEVSAVVLDVGTTTTRAGSANKAYRVHSLSFTYMLACFSYAGEDTPRVVTPSSYGYIAADGEADGATANNGAGSSKSGQYFIGDASGPAVYRAGKTVHSPLRDGVIEDWPGVERIVEGALRGQMRLSSLEEHPLLVSEPTWQSKENRERWTELAFEGWGAPAFYSVDKNVLTSFSVGKGTSLILDVGEDVTSCMPIYDGFVIRKGRSTILLKPTEPFLTI